MRKDYRDAIISGILGGLGVITALYLVREKIRWVYIIYPIGFAIAHLIGKNLRKRREAKKEEEVPAEGVT